MAERSSANWEPFCKNDSLACRRGGGQSVRGFRAKSNNFYQVRGRNKRVRTGAMIDKTKRRPLKEVTKREKVRPEGQAGGYGGLINKIRRECWEGIQGGIRN